MVEALLINHVPVYSLFEYASLDMSKCLRADCMHSEYAGDACTPCVSANLHAIYAGTWEEGLLPD